MQNNPNQSIFRIFSANHWNQSETIVFNFHSLLSFLTFEKSLTFFSNAEKMRKLACNEIKNRKQESFRTIWSIGFIIRFSFIHYCIKLLNLVRR